jgi:site-specific DNA-methyltransferase (adenine-specific)
MIRIEAGDALDIIPRLVAEGVVVDSIVTDAPYHLTARTSRFGKEGSAPPQYGNDGAMGRLSKGFMGKQWDGGDIAFRPETWVTIGTVLRPGGFLVAFGGTRTYHRMTCAIEDAGFVIQDCVMWLYGTGFPKRRDMLKPAFEPIAVAYKPGGDRTMQIDESRVGGEPSPSAAYRAKGKAPSSCRPGEYGDGHAIQNRIRPENWLKENPGEQLGRWPANVCHDGSDEVVSMFPNSRFIGHHPARRNSAGLWSGEGGGLNGNTGSNETTDAGSAARFFWSPKANKKDRAGSKHPTVKPVTLLDWLVPLVTPIGGTVLDPFAGSGTTGSAAENTGRHAILIEREPEYLSDIYRRFGMTLEAAFSRLTEVLSHVSAG